MTRIKITGPKGTVEVETPKTVAKDDYSSVNMTLAALLEQAVTAYNALND